MIFRRRRKDDPVAAIDAFWAWWATARPRAERQITGDADDRLIAEIGALVSAIHPELEWEFTAGTASRHLLVVSACGDPALRSLAERWRRAGPAPDETFGYASARQGSPDALDGGHLSIAGHELDLDELRFSAEPDEERDCVHVEVWHPAFPSMPDGARNQVAFLSLDWLLGEDGVEIWVGGIEAITTPGATLTGPELAALVAALDPADGEPRWRAMSGTVDGHPVVAIAQSPLRPARWPGHDLHVRLEVPYHRRDGNGLPTKEALADLHALEDHISVHADGAVVVAHETSDGLRTTHLYADRPAAAHALEPLISSWPDGRVRLTVTPDPAWEQIAHLNP
ncbi:DUF695 domain-containing protein [Actinoplanes sp. NPDC051861]|uniref:DUF695 domain-containing protein n=1 Tax=Actinoplanes sp. NPDC051861 TaxID=3155170 RepID=UPI0034280DDB